MCVTVEVEM